MRETVTTWSTPMTFFNAVLHEFNFTLDVCALPSTAKLPRFFSPDDNGLAQDWSEEVVWMNPPYGRGQNVYAWVEKAYMSAFHGGAICVCLLPASVDTKWFHDFVMHAAEIRFIKDRIWFELNGIPGRANHASMLVVFRPIANSSPVISSMSNHRTITK